MTEQASDDIPDFVPPDKGGFTFMELVVVIALIGVLASIGLKAMGNVATNIKFNSTLKELTELKEAIVGSPAVMQNQSRSSFGYYGDIGALPSNLNDLIEQGTHPAFTVNTALEMSYGWNGPYLKGNFTQDASGQLTDGFGNAYIYSTTRSVTGDGDSVYATIKSYGADGSSGGTGVDEDIVIYIYKSELRGSIKGNAYDTNDFGFDDVVVNLYYPDGSGGLTSSNVVSSLGGYYFFSDVPFGIRSITYIPPGGVETAGNRVWIASKSNPQPDKLNLGSLLLVGTPVTAGASHQRVKFDIRNKLGVRVKITDFRATYTHPSLNPTYNRLEIGTNVAWVMGSIRAGSGDRLTEVPGGTWTNRNIPDNATRTFLLKNFKDGGDVDMRNTSFEVRIYLQTGQYYNFSFTVTT